MRDLQKLWTTAYDLLVVGGGAHGAAVAYHAAGAGLKTALVEKGDFCSATSANSLKIIHGGLRYLQHGNIKRMRHSIQARREMMQVAPHLVKPLACLMPTFGSGLRSKRAMQAALLLNDLISFDRNGRLPPELHLPRGRVVSRADCLRVVPGLADSATTGAAVWYDAVALDSERLVLEYILAARDRGARAANYLQYLGLARESDGLYRVQLLDRLTGQRGEASAAAVVNAAGPWFEHVAPAVQGRGQKWSLALNIVCRRKIFEDYAVALEGAEEYLDKDALLKRGKRLYFFVPWHGRTMIGTEYRLHLGNPEKARVEAADIRNMIAGVNAIYPAAELRFEDISFYHAGLMPIQSGSREGDIQLEKNSAFIDHDGEGFPGVLSIRGVKYTTAPFIAAEIVDHLLARRPVGGSSTAGKEPPARTDSAGGVTPSFPHLQRRYGRRAARVMAHQQESESAAPWVDEGKTILKAELRYLVEEEMACSLADVVLRRTGIGTAECPSAATLEGIAAYMGAMLGWDGKRCAEETAALVERYQPLPRREV